MEPTRTAHARTIRETPLEGDLPAFVHPEWSERWPWLVQGITGRGVGEPFDMSLFTASPSRGVQERWRALFDRTGFDVAVHARQVHGAAVRLHDRVPPGLLLAPDCDGHATAAPGVLLGVTVADCVPVWLVAPERRCVALLHAGWRGVAAGVLGAGIATLADRLDVCADAVEVHLGPAICGACYEVGPEVHERLGLAPPAAAEPVDLHAALSDRAVAAGVRAAAITRSGRCTRCGEGGFFSHRGGDPFRQLAFVGVRP